MSTEIVPADRNHRRLVLLATLLLSIGGFVLLAVLNGQIRGIKAAAQEDLPEAVDRMLRLTAIIAWVGGLAFVGAAVWLWRLGQRVRRSGRYPPEGMKVIRDTPVRTGSDAQSVANVATMAAIMCLMLGTGGMWYLYDLAAAALGR